MSNKKKGIMKEAQVYYQGKEVTTVVFDKIENTLGELTFYLEKKEVAFFNDGYSYSLKSNASCTMQFFVVDKNKFEQQNNNVK